MLILVIINIEELETRARNLSVNKLLSYSVLQSKVKFVP